jgi:hypothetical protein
MSYEQQWSEHKRRRNQMLMAFVLFLFVAGGTVFATMILGIPFPVLVIPLLGSAAVMYTAFRHYLYWPCPRCKKAFLGPIARPNNCFFCGLPRWATTEDEEPPRHRM